MKVRDIMTTDPVKVTGDTRLKEAARLMVRHRVSGLPVVDDAGKLIGILSEGDFIRREAGRDRPHGVSLLDAVFGEGELQPVGAECVAEIMTRRRLKRLPVVGEHGALVGMVSRVDLLRTAAGRFERKEPVAQELGLQGNVPLSRVMRRDAPTVHPDTGLAEVFQAVISTRLNHALVVDADRRVVGVVTDAEMLERLTPSLRSGALRSLMHRLPFVHASPDDRAAEQHARARRASDLMDPDVATATEDTLLGDAVGAMLRGSQKVLAVTDAAGRLVGMVDRADLLHGLAPHEYGA